MAHHLERINPAAEPLLKLTDDLHEGEIRLWVDYTPHGDSDLCLVFGDADVFRAWLDEVLSEARHQRLIT